MSIKNPQSPQALNAGKTIKQAASEYFYLGMALFLMLIVFVGFWPSYFSTILPANEMSPPTGGVIWVIHVHALVFIGWLVALLVQTILIARKRIGTHMKIGRYGLFIGGAVFITGLLVLSLSSAARIASGESSLTGETIFTVGVWMQMVNFAILLGLGYKNRRRPSHHKRYMLFATIAILPAAVIRMWYIFGMWSLLIFLVLILGITLGHDLLRLKRIHKATLIGAGLLLADVVLLILGFH